MKYERHPFSVRHHSPKKHINLDIIKKIVSSKSIKCLNALLCTGWDCNTPFVYCTESGTKSVTALLLATERNWCDGVAALVNYGATTDVATVPVEIGINGGICVSRKWFQPLYTPLMYAVKHGCLRCLETLINAKCDVNFVENVTQTNALRLALYEGHVDCVQALVKAKADVKTVGDPLYFPIGSPRTLYAYCPCSPLIAAIRHFNGTIHINCTPSPVTVDYSVRTVWLNIIKTLLNNSCNVDHNGCHLETAPLIESVESRDTRVLELLLHHGADTNIKSHVKLQTSPKVITALDLACYANNFPAVQLLIEYGAPIETVSEELFKHILKNDFLDVAILFVLAGFKMPPSFQDILEKDASDIDIPNRNKEVFTSLFTLPWSLQALCRKTLRVDHELVQRNSLEKTGLPLGLQDYVLFKYIW